MARAIMEAFASGRVDRLDVYENELFSLAQGWSAELIYSGNIRDVYIKFGQKGGVLPLHNHPQIEHLYVLSGKITLGVGTTDATEPVTETEMQAGDGRIIPAHHYHSIVASGDGDAIVIVAFEPPLSRRRRQHGY